MNSEDTLESMKRENEGLKNIIKTMSSKITEHCKLLMDRDVTMMSYIDKKDKECNHVTKTVTYLVSRNAELTTKLSQSKWQAFRKKSPHPRTVLIGSSNVKDIDRNKLTNTIVKCLPGAKVVTLTGKVEQLPDNSYDRLVIVGGFNSCSNTKDSTTVVSDFKVMINAAKCKANTVTVSSVCPQGDKDV